MPNSYVLDTWVDFPDAGNKMLETIRKSLWLGLKLVPAVLKLTVPLIIY